MKSAHAIYAGQLTEIDNRGLRKPERVIDGPQGVWILTSDGRNVLNLCANNYLGLAADPRVIEAARSSLDKWGYGLSSVRFICGTQSIHKELESSIARFVGMEDAILYSSCFDANGGLFETLLGEQDAVISDELNHASIIDGIRLCKAKRYRYRNNDMDDLRQQLETARSEGARIILIATDGVFSMDGSMANLPSICDLADVHDALVMVDDSHATGFVGENGRGTPEYYDVQDRVDILTGTFGKALGGGSGGFTCAGSDIVDLLRQRSRPYLFSNSLTPSVAAATIEVLSILEKDLNLCKALRANSDYFRQLISQTGFDILPGEHPIVPVMIYDEAEAIRVAARMLELGVYVVGFTYPVVPLGKARIRVQISSGHSRKDLEFAAECFSQVRREISDRKTV